MKPSRPLLLAILMFGTLALVGSGASVTEDGEIFASKAEDIAGIWTHQYHESDGYYTQFNEDGTYNVAESIDELESPFQWGPFWFEGTVFNIDGEAKSGLGRYEIRVRKEGGESVELFFTVVDDIWPRRATDFTAEGWRRVKP